MNFLRKNWPTLMVFFVALAFFILTAGFNFFLHQPDYVKWASPDETANYFFAKNFAQTGQLQVFEPANIIDEEVVRPRSVRSDHGWLKPVSFLGIIIFYGWLGAWLGVAIIPYITPFLAAVGILFFYFFVKRLFNSRIALISATLLAFFPVYIYYSVRSLFHNVLFTVFLIISLYFLSLAVSRAYSYKDKFFKFKLSLKTWLGFLWSFLGGLALGGATAARTSELLWLLPALFIAWLFYFRRLGWRVFLILAGLGLGFLPIAYYNQLLYGAPLYGGYAEMNTSLQQISQAGSVFTKSALSGQLSYFNELWLILRDNIFYFGYNPRQSLGMVYRYVVLMFPYLCALSGLGVLIFLIGWGRNLRRWRLAYLSSWLALSFILIIYYGSWQFFDNPDPDRYTIGNSYTRYWLPVYLLALPLASLAIVALSRWLSGVFGKINLSRMSGRIKKLMMTGWQALAVLLWIIISLDFVFFGSEEGLAHLYHNHWRDKADVARVLEFTEEEAIIVTQYHDKQLFPERRVVVALFNHDYTNRSLGKIINYYPVYYYNFAFPEDDFNYLNERRLPPFGFNIELILQQGRFGLYRLVEFKSEVEPEAEEELLD